MDVVDEFIKRYSREYDYYHEVARFCAQLCELKLHSNGIRAIVTFRAKNILKLREKLVKRKKEKLYQTYDDICHDIVDLSGVRIALYFPNDRTVVDKLIKDSFVDIKDKLFPEEEKRNSNSEIYKKQFFGYSAKHYRLKLNPKDLSEINKRYSETNIEIQVASIIMHAWAEVEHDLIYKPVDGNLSYDEHAILDSINGLMISGEIMLDNLQRAVKVRVNKLDAKFNNHYELAAFLADYIKAKNPETFKELNLEKVNLLFRFLQLSNLDAPQHLTIYLKHVKNPSDLIDDVINNIIGDSTSLCKQFIEAKRDTRNSNKEANISIETEALMHASSIGRVNLVSNLLDEGADIDCKTTDGTAKMGALATAIIHKKYPVIKLLLDRGADVNVSDLYFGSPLMLAAINEDIEVVQLLLEKGANINFKNKNGQTPLFMARQNEELSNFLISKGALK